MGVLPRSFYARDPVVVARDLLGKNVRHGAVVLRITEVEAYRWPGDTACHARSGRTKRNDALWGPPGRAYVYLCYGLHHMLNVVTMDEGVAAAVLIRSCELIDGRSVVRRRRGGVEGPSLLTGPGKIAQALGIDVSFSHRPLYRQGGLVLEHGPPPERMLAGPRVGIDYALDEHRVLPWRFASGDTKWVSHPAGLAPVQF